MGAHTAVRAPLTDLVTDAHTAVQATLTALVTGAHTAVQVTLTALVTDAHRPVWATLTVLLWENSDSLCSCTCSSLRVSRLHLGTPQQVGAHNPAAR